MCLYTLQQILELLNNLTKKFDMSLLLITHDLGIVKKLSDRICVMKLGRIMEIGKTSSIFNKPKNDYTKKLINSEPKSKLMSQKQSSKTILDVSELEVDYEIQKRFLWKPKKTFKAVNKVNFKLLEGETLGIVGESGSGKSSLAQALLKLISSHGQIKFFDNLISDFNQNKFRKIRKNIQIIFQDPFASLSPRMTIENIIEEGLNVHRIAESKKKKL